MFLRCILVLLMLSLCACGAPRYKDVTPTISAMMQSDLRQGNLVLRDDINSAFHFIGAWRPMARAFNSSQWDQLVELVMANGLANDLNYFFLGYAAEQKGYLPAAQKFYTEALRLTRMNYSNNCRELLSYSGCPLNLPAVIPPQLQYVSNKIATQARAVAEEEERRKREADAAKKRKTPSQNAGATQGKTPEPKTQPTPSTAQADPPRTKIEPISIPPENPAEKKITPAQKNTKTVEAGKEDEYQ